MFRPIHNSAVVDDIALRFVPSTKHKLKLDDGSAETDHQVLRITIMYDNGEKIGHSDIELAEVPNIPTLLVGIRKTAEKIAIVVGQDSKAAGDKAVAAWNILAEQLGEVKRDVEKSEPSAHETFTAI